jgi:hypothetical protein
MLVKCCNSSGEDRTGIADEVYNFLFAVSVANFKPDC